MSSPAFLRRTAKESADIAAEYQSGTFPILVWKYSQSDTVKVEQRNLKVESSPKLFGLTSFDTKFYPLVLARFRVVI